MLARRFFGGATEEAMALNFVHARCFMLRTQTIEPLLDLALADGEFEPETGQDDGTMAHAVERAFSVAVCKANLRVISSGHIGKPPERCGKKA